MTYENMTDYELVKTGMSNDKSASNAAFAEIVKRYKNLIYSIILRMTNDPEEANDLAQDVFVKVYRNLDKYYPEYKLSTWLMKITTNHVIDSRRRKKQETVPIDDITHGKASAETSPEEVCIKRERSEILLKAVSGLPDIYKVPIVLYHQQGLSYQEITEITGEPLSKVKNRIFRGRKMLKDALLTQGGAQFYVS